MGSMGRGGTGRTGESDATLLAMNPDQNTIALWAVILSGAVGLAGVTVTGLSGWRDRAHADKERRQRRLEAAYLDVLALVETVGEWCEEAGEPGQPQSPDLGGHLQIRTKVNAYGSTEMISALTSWSSTVHAIIKAVQQQQQQRQPLSAAGDASGGSAVAMTRPALDPDLRRREFAARVEVSQLAKRELR